MPFVPSVDLLIWLALMLAVPFALLRRIPIALLLLATSLLLALFLGRIAAPTLILVGLLLALAFKLPQWRQRFCRQANSAKSAAANNEANEQGHIRLKQFAVYGAQGLILLSAVALAVHLLPGFDNLKLLDKVQASSGSAPFSMYLNLDKPLSLFLLLLAWPLVAGTPKSLPRRKIILLALLFAATPALLGLASLSGAIHWDPKLPGWWWLFALNNLLLTCVAEEVLFRGALQQYLVKRGGALLGITLASVLFGLAHLAGGWTLVLFAALAGVLYGLVFHLSGRLWLAALCHFCLNFCHLLLFSYPMALPH
ncbi:CPBP family intramembrane glutamic endopeptidase [Shewanella sp. Iso12]|uniref:CPBP family intramembrane glutamic endopeptidase n=1 Tax=Shewanella sp. Iso12 TaxID=1826753 RepID=UPI001431D70B|nr:CPBP family intramembrane glutamic endopeptidase [Shewanella sp. Iso12]NJI86312.1 CPBP family intramembrane metalloprotease [Shewanella sp. Iso12]